MNNLQTIKYNTSKIVPTARVTMDYSDFLLVENYSHTISAQLGFDSCEIIYVSNVPDRFQDLYKSLLGLDVTCYSPDGIVTWNGFVNEIEVYHHNKIVRVGPLSSIVNKIKVSYTSVRYDVIGIGGTNEETDWASNEYSQELYGTYEEVLSIGETYSQIAEQYRDKFLASGQAFPAVMEEPDFSKSTPQLIVRCSGYATLLSTYHWGCEEPTTSQLDARLKILLEASPNPVFSTNYSYVEENSLTIPCENADINKASTLIENIIGLGDSSYNLWVFGIYEHQQAVYKAVDKNPALTYLTNNGQGLIYDNNSIQIPPYLIRPGQYMQIIDIGSSHNQAYPIAVLSAPSIIYIESVTFSYPNDLTISSTRVSTLDQFLAQNGLK